MKKISSKQSKAQLLDDMKQAMTEHWKQYKSEQWCTKKKMKDQRERVKALCTPAVGQYDIVGTLGKGGMPFPTMINSRLDMLQHRARSLPGPGEYHLRSSFFTHATREGNRLPESNAFSQRAVDTPGYVGHSLPKSGAARLTRPPRMPHTLASAHLIDTKTESSSSCVNGFRLPDA